MAKPAASEFCGDSRHVPACAVWERHLTSHGKVAAVITTGLPGHQAPAAAAFADGLSLHLSNLPPGRSQPSTGRQRPEGRSRHLDQCGASTPRGKGEAGNQEARMPPLVLLPATCYLRALPVSLSVPRALLRVASATEGLLDCPPRVVPPARKCPQIKGRRGP